MGSDRRKNGRYYYRAARANGRVVMPYVGTGRVAELEERLDRAKAEKKRLDGWPDGLARPVGGRAERGNPGGRGRAGGVAAGGRAAPPQSLAVVRRLKLPDLLAVVQVGGSGEPGRLSPAEG